MRKRLVWLGLFSAGMVSIGMAHAQAVDPSSRMQQIIADAVQRQSFMGTVLVVKDGKTLVDDGYGMADLEWKVPNTPAAKFRLGSLTKQFTAAGILLLEERGRIHVDDLVSTYMPDAPPAWAKITIFHLLTHTSGIPNFTGFPEYHSLEWKSTTGEQLVARFKDKPLDFEPGAKYSYSNSGYVLLGYLIEKVSGQTYADFVRQNEFEPLEMRDTGVDDDREILPARAQGYSKGPKGLQHAGYISMTVPLGAGDLYSTTGDLLKWENALFGGKLLKPVSFRRMTTPNKEDYGFGVIVTQADGHKLVTHNGGIEGFVTYMAEFPDDKLTVIVLANCDAANPGALGANLGKVALGMPVTLASERKEVAVAATTLQQYAGVYRLSPTFAITMTVEDGKLMTQATGQPKFPLFGESEDKFFLKVVDAQVEFTRDPATKTVTGMVLYQNGRATPGKRQ
jgi:CubicO group peptidase (beta-lactamase class C family)